MIKLLLAGFLLAIPSAFPAAHIKTSLKVERPQPIIGPKVSAPTVRIIDQAAGPTPFISQIHVMISPADALTSIQFTVTPKPGSVTRPISATYTTNYLQARGYLNTGTGEAFIPVFGLYANYSNTAVLNFSFTDGSSQQNSVSVPTAAWNDTCGGAYNNPTVVQARTASTGLSYDYILIKNICGSQSPVIMDTDGAFRWVGPIGFDTPSSIFFANGIYVSSTPTSGSSQTGIARIELDAMLTFFHDYSGIGVTATDHHNADPGRDGILWEVNTTGQTESVILEIDTLGNVLKTWNFADIISQAMTAGGDNPSQFVGSGSTDWFHNNAATYRKSDNTLIVSSRENFVIAVDYDTQQIKWILGDPTKQWYQFPSLRQYALTPGANSLPPIGQHAVSITHDDDLLLFDDGLSSLSHSPAGADRTYSTPRKYEIDTQAKVALEVWNYPNGQSVYSAICSSTYEDSPVNYLIGYADITTPAAPFGGTMVELLGLTDATTKVFDYKYTSPPCAAMWNAIQIHLEALRFTSVQPLKAVSRKIHGGTGTFDMDLPLNAAPAIECRSGGASGSYQVVVTFAKAVMVTGATVTPGSGGTASVSGSPIVSGNNVAVNLTGVSNAQTLTVNLIGVSDGTNTDNVSVPMSVLIGDTNEDGFVNSVDISQTKSQPGKAVTNANFREDLNADGFINSADISLVKSRSGTALP